MFHYHKAMRGMNGYRKQYAEGGDIEGQLPFQFSVVLTRSLKPESYTQKNEPHVAAYSRAQDPMNHSTISAFPFEWGETERVDISHLFPRLFALPCFPFYSHTSSPNLTWTGPNLRNIGRLNSVRLHKYAARNIQ